jgi:alkylation response protein AidB-like acyl-CoA dehydrogenase
VPIYKAPVEDVLFVLDDVLQIGRYDNLPGFADAGPDIRRAILEGAGTFCEDVLTPLNRAGDIEGCTRSSDGTVATPTGFREAFKQYGDGGWMGISVPTEFGGQGLPTVLTTAVGEMMTSANLAFSMYAGLTRGAVDALIAHGTPEQKAAYVPKMVAGRWTGTMNLRKPIAAPISAFFAPRR